MPSDRGWLHERTISHVESGRELNETFGRSTELLGHPAIVQHPECPLSGPITQVVLAVEAVLAHTAAVEPFDGHGPAIGSLAHELVAQYDFAAKGKVGQIRGADSHGTHGQEFALARRFVNVDEQRPAVMAPHGFHR
jgi:hypothetical protein